jgi:hypothetical protein
MAAAQLEPGRDYGEGEVNDKLVAWLETFCDPYGLDHVTLRRMLVDSRLLSRTASGSRYRINPERLSEIEAVAAADPREVLEEIRAERASRKRGRED